MATIAILALQGAFAEHEQMLQRLGAETMLIRNLSDWQAFAALRESGCRTGLVIPGGESTAMLRIMRDEELMQPMRQALADGLPVFGTCAGMILLARTVDNDDRERLATMDIVVRRNAYGRQLGSFYTESAFTFVADNAETATQASASATQPATQQTSETVTTAKVPMTFIRAPYIVSVSDGVSILAVVDGNIVAARQGHQLVCSFHPELNDDTRIHQYFLDMIG